MNASPDDLARRAGYEHLIEVFTPVLDPDDPDAVEWHEVASGNTVSFDEIVVPFMEARMSNLRARTNKLDPWFWLLDWAVVRERVRVRREAVAASLQDEPLASDLLRR